MEIKNYKKYLDGVDTKDLSEEKKKEILKEISNNIFSVLSEYKDIEGTDKYNNILNDLLELTSYKIENIYDGNQIIIDKTFYFVMKTLLNNKSIKINLLKKNIQKLVNGQIFISNKDISLKLRKYFSNKDNFKNLDKNIHKLFGNCIFFLKDLSEIERAELLKIKKKYFVIYQIYQNKGITKKEFDTEVNYLLMIFVGIFLTYFDRLNIFKNGTDIKNTNQLCSIMNKKLEGKNNIVKFDNIKLLKEFLTNNIKTKHNIKIDISLLDKSEIYKILSNNFPMLSVLRLLENSTIINFMFNGIKHINDNFDQKKTDVLLEILKNKIEKLLNNGRIIRKNYKNFTFSGSFTQNQIKDINNFINNIDYEKIILENKNDFNFSNKEELKHFIEEVKSNIKIGAGYSSINADDNFFRKLHGYYEAEIISKSSNNEILEYEDKIIMEYINKTIEYKKEIIAKYKNKFIQLRGQIIPIIKNGDTDKVLINDTILRIVKKNKYNISEEVTELYNDIKIFLDILNKGLDFIAPFTKYRNDLIVSKELDEQFKNGKIDIKYFLSTYKSVVPKEIFNDYIIGKKGVLYFIDIKDMGIMNIHDFYNKALRKNRLKKITLITTGIKVTRNIINAVNKIKEKLPNALISIGGDEIFIFDENGSINNSDIICELFGIYDMNGRILKTRGTIHKDTLSILDGNDHIIKKIENMLELHNKKNTINWITLKNNDNFIMKEEKLVLKNIKQFDWSMLFKKKGVRFVIGKYEDKKVYAVNSDNYLLIEIK